MMFTEITVEMLRDDNYNEALAYCAMRLTACADFDEVDTVFDEIDSKLWELACNSTIDEATDTALRLSTAMEIILDNLSLED